MSSLLARAHRTVAQKCREGLNFGVADSLEDVVEAWSLVHDAYVRRGLIDPNELGIHTVPQAASPASLVTIARLGPLAVGTMTAVLDEEGGLPSDCVFRPQLDELRARGARLLELCLFADRREQIQRSFGAVLELMRLAFFFGAYTGVTDAVISVVPHHARFYSSYFAFEQVGGPIPHPVVKNTPVVLMHLDAQARMHGPRAAGFRYFLANPVPAEAYECRYRFDEAEVKASVIGGVLGRTATDPRV